MTVTKFDTPLVTSVVTRQAKAPSRLLHFFPSLTDVAFLLPILLIFRLGGLTFLLADGDTGWHIRTGQWILKNGRVPSMDIFSFTKSGAPWFAWEWLWDVAFGWLDLRFGLTATVIGSLAFICLATALTYRIALRASGNPVLAMAVTMVGAVVSSVHWIARPHLLTLVFTCVFVMVLERARRGDRRWLAALPAITILWTNLHGGFFIGLLMLGAYTGGELCSWLFEAGRAQRTAALKSCGVYLATMLGCLAASFVNPYGYHLHEHILSYLRDPFIFDRITEFQSFDFHHTVGPFFALLILLGAWASFWHLMRGRYGWVLLVVGTGWMGLEAARNVPLFVICAAAPITLALDEMLQGLAGASIAPYWGRAIRAFQSFAGEIRELEKPWRAYLPAMAAFGALIAITLAPNPPKSFRAEYDAKQFPVQAAAVLEVSPADRIFAPDTWGGYLIYRFYPRIRVFQDGRSDFYGAQLGREFVEIALGRPGWEAKLKKFGADGVLLPIGATLTGVLKESHNWKPVYDDGTSILFRPSVQNMSQACGSIEIPSGRRDRAITKTDHL
jgi:hypothetical protein